MKGMPRTVMTLAAAALLSACASGPEIHSDYDRSVDFTEYRTYNFFNPMGIEDRGYSSIAGQVFREAISEQMEQRGYVKADDPDLLLNVSATMEDKTKVTTYDEPMYPGYYGYRAGFYDPWYGYGYGTSTHVSQYTEGTVNIDMVDTQAMRMVWEGVAVGRVEGKKTNEELRTAIRAGVTEMFSEYPFRAAQ